MRIGLVAPPWVPVPPGRYGGTEQVIDDLARGLQRLGHDVRLFTVGDASCPVPRQWYFEKAQHPFGTTMEEAAHVLSAYRGLAGVDVIHDHTILGPLLAGRTSTDPPVVTTHHGPFTADARVIFREITATADLVAISHSQRSSAPELPVAAVIHHGIDLDRYTYGEGVDGHLIFVGRMTADKGVDRAMRVARVAGRPLVVISKMRDQDERAYYERYVRPLMGSDVQLHEELPAADRIELLRSAAGLLNPICWPEPFGLVMAEALACGTPVLAFPNGAAPEIVTHGKTGFLCADERAMVEAVARIGEIDRRTCRASCELRFDMMRMSADYEALYERVVDRRVGPARSSMPAWA